ncbi:hypothetical protein L3V82_04100 [Thiotrichales bacterium 19S3-7]|nr:hypothetical protein [Thiotrichales bacterium 19S3-7]MCF6801857.1 hypothetical protein [Thiotrichales bacterium 19S3-11]
MAEKVAYFIFRGTGMDGKYQDSLYKIYQSAVDNIGEERSFIYNGPGTYQNQAGWFGWISPLEWYRYNMSYLGTVTGFHGPNSWDETIEDAFNKIKQMVPQPERLYFAGHSRGAITAFMLANKLANDPSLKAIKITITAFDPVIGITGNYRQDQTTLAENVESCQTFVASECSLIGFTSIVPSVSATTESRTHKVPTHHNGVIGLDIGWNFLNHASLNTDTAQLCLDSTLHQFNLPCSFKKVYRKPSTDDLSKLKSGPNGIGYNKRVHIDKSTKLLRHTELVSEIHETLIFYNREGSEETSFKHEI